MLTAAEGLVGGERGVCIPLAEVTLDRYSEPEWLPDALHSFRRPGPLSLDPPFLSMESSGREI